MKLSKIFEEILGEDRFIFNEAASSEPCGCCKYFNEPFSGDGDAYGGLNHPIYYAIEKRKEEIMKYISPEQYMRAIAKGFGMSYEEAMNSNAIDKGKVQRFIKYMKKGDKFPIGFYTEGSGSQEGRHRALALIEIGCDEMPIIVMRNLNYDEIREMVISYKGYSFDEVNQIYINKGYKGISGLDWRTLKNYIDYRL